MADKFLNAPATAKMLILAHKSNINKAEKHCSTPLHLLFMFFCHEK